MLTVYWFGICPRCGSREISSYAYVNVCNKCGKFTEKSSIIRRERKMKTLFQYSIREYVEERGEEMRLMCYHYLPKDIMDAALSLLKVSIREAYSLGWVNKSEEIK